MRWFLGVCLLIASVSPARAEYWLSDMGTFLKTARSIEIVRVDTVKNGVASGKVVRSIRGKKRGTKTTVRVISGVTVAPKQDLLVVCDTSQCPRAMGVDQGGYFVLTAEEPGDGANVYPGLVEATSVAKLASGSAAPKLCVRAEVTFLDDKPVSVEAKVAADVGSGKVTGTLFSGARAHLSADDSPGGFQLSVEDKGRAALVGPLARAGDGCYVGKMTPTAPLARTPRALRDALDGNGRDELIADGKLSLGKIDHDVRWVVTTTGQLRIESSLVTDSGDLVSIRASTGELGFAVTAKRQLVVKFGPSLTYPAALGLATMMQAATSVSFSVQLVEGGKVVSSGTMALTYQPAAK